MNKDYLDYNERRIFDLEEEAALLRGKVGLLLASVRMVYGIVKSPGRMPKNARSMIAGIVREFAE